MPIELIIGLVVIVAWRIIAGMRIPVLSAVLRAIWNLSFTVSSFIPFFGWAAHFIIADTAKEKQDKEEMISVGESMDGMVNAPWSGSSAGSVSGSIQTGDTFRDSNGNSYRARREGHLLYLTRNDGTEVVVDTDFADVDGASSFTVNGIHFTK